MTKKIPVKASNGNVFADLGLANSEELILRAELAQRIAEILRDRKLTQSEAAKSLGINQSDLSAIINGRLNKYGLEKLLRFISILGNNIQITIKPTRRHSPGRMELAVA